MLVSVLVSVSASVSVSVPVSAMKKKMISLVGDCLFKKICSLMHMAWCGYCYGSGCGCGCGWW